MKIGVDVKPVGAFIEYTLKPLIDYSHELLDLLDEHGLKGRDIVQSAVKLYLADILARSITSILVTGMICYTAYLCLSTRP